MIAFYDFEVFKHDWLVVFKTTSHVYKIHNDRDKLKKILKNFSLLIGFNNHNYDDYILAELLRDKVVTEVYDLSQSIVIDKIKPKIRLNFPTIDVMQEMKQGVGLKEIEANLKLNIHETPVNFNLKRKLFDHEIEKTFQYCENDVKVTETIFNLRSDYFQSKFEIIQEFGLDSMCVKNTRAILASKVLKCRKINLPNDRLNLTYDERLDLDKIPETIRNFYINIEKKFNAGGNFEELEKEQLEYNLNGVPHFFGFGGLHGAVDNLIYEGNMLCIDVGSYYPSLMINNNFISRASESPELYKNLYKKRMEYKAKKDGRQQVYKILLNATFGAMKSGFNKLFDPVQSNNICVNGQLILTDLIIRISSLCKIIQSNTDGLIVAYDEKNLEKILKICKEWENQYNLTLDYDYAVKIAQRDVNNYCLKYKNGKIKTKGRFGYNEGGNFERTSLSIIDMALTEYYMNDRDIDLYLIEQYKNNNIIPFQLIAKMGGTFSKIIHEIYEEKSDNDGNWQDQGYSHMIELQKINRVFATNDKKYGALYKIKIEDGVERFHKIANCPENAIVHNEEMDTFDKSLINLNYYSELIKSNLIKREVGLNDFNTG